MSALARCLRVAVTAIALAMPATGHADEGFVRQSMQAGGAPREYLVRTPQHAGASPRPLVILLHGHGGSAVQLTGERGRAAPYRRWAAIADREGLVLIAPDGLKGADERSGWNDCRRDAATNPSGDDVAFIEALIAASARQHGADAQRVFVVGTSNGGMMALRLAIERPALLRGAAAIVAAMPAQSQCAPPARAVPLLFVNGTRDPIVPYEGGRVGRRGDGRGSVLSAEGSAAIWAALAGAATPPQREALPDLNTRDGSRIVRETHLVQGRPAVVAYRAEGAGHVEPSISERYARLYTALVGAQNADIETADEVWQFFAAQLAR
jgi:polyhydroxybutyrate depolymerase